MSNDAEMANILERLENIRSEYDMFPDDYGALTVAIESVKMAQTDNSDAESRVLHALDEVRQFCNGKSCDDCMFSADGKASHCEIRRRVSTNSDGRQVNSPCFWRTGGAVK